MRKISLIFILFLLPFSLQSKRCYPPFSNLQTSASSVQVYCYWSESILIFDTNGHFISEKRLLYNNRNISGSQCFPMDDGGQWVIDRGSSSNASCSIKSRSKPSQTWFHFYDKKGSLIVTYSIPGRWEGYLTKHLRYFIKTEKDNFIIIHDFNPKTGLSTPFFQISEKVLLSKLKLKEMQLNSWAVDNRDRIILLLEKGSNGIVFVCSRDSSFEKNWEVQPDPVTSVSYIKELRVDAKNNIYVTHSSWEVSSATENSGSIAKFTPEGKLLMRIKHSVGYADEMSVSPDGAVFIVCGGSNLDKFSSFGRHLLSWLAVPPPPGISWQERLYIQQNINLFNSRTPIKKLIQAYLVSIGEDSDRIETLLEKKGGETIKPITETLLAMYKTNDHWKIFELAKKIWKQNLPQALPYLEEIYKKGSHGEKLLIATTLAENGKTNLENIRNLLDQISNTKDFPYVMRNDAADALKKIDPFAGFKAELESVRGTWGGNDIDMDLSHAIYINYKETLPFLEKIIFDPKEKLRPVLRKLIVKARQGWDGEGGKGDKKNVIPKEFIQMVSKWLKNKDLFVVETAAMILTTFGVPDHQQIVIKMARNDSTLTPLVMAAFQGLSDKNIAWVEPWGTSLAEIAIDFSRRNRFGGSNCFENLFSIRTKSGQEKCIEALSSNDVSVRVKSEILWGMNFTFENINSQTLSKIKSNPQWFIDSPELYSPYSSFLEDCIRKEPGQSIEIRNIFFLLIDKIEKHQENLANNRMNPRASKWNDGLKNLLDDMENVVRPEDGRLLERLMKKSWLSDEARHQIFPLLEKTGLPNSLIPQIEKYLEDDDFALQAARLLCLKGNQKALTVLIEKGLKRSGGYSHQQFDANLFRTFGKKGIAELMKLLDYPDTGPQMWAKYLLASLKAEEYYPRLKKEYKENIKTNTFESEFFIGFMELYGYDTIPDIIGIALLNKGRTPSLSGFGIFKFPENFKERIKSYILKESDEAKITILIKLFFSLDLDRKEEIAILTDLAKNHSIKAVREILNQALKEKIKQ